MTALAPRPSRTGMWLLIPSPLWIGLVFGGLLVGSLGAGFCDDGDCASTARGKGALMALIGGVPLLIGLVKIIRPKHTEEPASGWIAWASGIAAGCVGAMFMVVVLAGGSMAGIVSLGMFAAPALVAMSVQGSREAHLAQDERAARALVGGWIALAAWALVAAILAAVA